MFLEHSKTFEEFVNGHKKTNKGQFVFPGYCSLSQWHFLHVGI